jgi:hypothetical protein
VRSQAPPLSWSPQAARVTSDTDERRSAQGIQQVLGQGETGSGDNLFVFAADHRDAQPCDTDAGVGRELLPAGAESRVDCLNGLRRFLNAVTADGVAPLWNPRS